MIQQKQPFSGTPLIEARPVETGHNDGLGRQILTGYVLIGAMLLGVVGWAGMTEINGAVVGGGRVMVQANEKLVQHPTGGVVGKIFVDDGSAVKEGDVLMRLNDTTVRANLDIVESGLSSLKARLARLKAESNHDDHITFPADMVAKPTAADTEAMRTETRFFETRRDALENHRQQLRRKIDQLTEQARGYDITIDSRKKQWDLFEDQLKTAQGLLDKNLSTRSQVASLQQNVTRLEGEYGAFLAEQAGLKAQIAEIEMQINGLDGDNLSDVMRDMRETEAKIAEDSARRLAALDQLARIDIRAPATGVVHELTVHTVGGVINPGETVMKVVPADSKLQFELRISTTDVDQVHVGQTAELKFPAFNRAHTPTVEGTVSFVSADASTDRQTGHSFYELKIDPEADIQAKLKEKGIALVPGMPVEAFIQTEQRTALSYILKPLTDQIDRAFREE